MYLNKLDHVVSHFTLVNWLIDMYNLLFLFTIYNEYLVWGGPVNLYRVNGGDKNYTSAELIP